MTGAAGRQGLDSARVCEVETADGWLVMDRFRQAGSLPTYVVVLVVEDESDVVVLKVTEARSIAFRAFEAALAAIGRPNSVTPPA